MSRESSIVISAAQLLQACERFIAETTQQFEDLRNRRINNLVGEKRWPWSLSVMTREQAIVEIAEELHFHQLHQASTLERAEGLKALCNIAMKVKAVNVLLSASDASMLEEYFE